MPSGNSYYIANHQRLAATEYLTDGVGIARWLVRSLDPQAAKPGATLNPNDPLTWALLTEPGTGRVYERLTDFDGNARYQDYGVLQADETLIADPTRRYFGGAGHVDLPSETHYSTFSNQVGSTELVTFADGSQAGRMRYTAFGEPLSATGGAALPRYGYAGAWGYEGGQASNSPGYVLDVAAEAGLLHVGARYYDPSVGRFLQRDPIGIGGGVNVYAYGDNHPAKHIDPTGHAFMPFESLFDPKPPGPDYIALDFYARDRARELFEAPDPPAPSYYPPRIPRPYDPYPNSSFFLDNTPSWLDDEGFVFGLSWSFHIVGELCLIPVPGGPAKELLELFYFIFSAATE